MKTCPFCAEEIQDAAIVCKHCGRELATAAVTAAPAPKRSRRWPWFVGIGIVLAYFLIQASRSDFLEFDARREDWHRRCDAYVNRSTGTDDELRRMRACKAELEELMTYAKGKGWGD